MGRSNGVVAAKGIQVQRIEILRQPGKRLDLCRPEPLGQAGFWPTSKGSVLMRAPPRGLGKDWVSLTLT